jgi:hypothetical protein
MTAIRAGDNRVLDVEAGDVIPKNLPLTLETGRSGLRRVGGYVEEEFLPQLRGRKAVQVYREMGDNSPIAGAMLYAIEQLLRQIEWRVEPASTRGEDRRNGEFVEQCMDDMSHSWSDLIAELLSMLQYGWAWHYLVYKRRVGPWERDPKRKSKYTDNLIGWRKIPIRGQETLLRWIFDENGGIQAMVQLSPPDYKTTVLPIERSLLFRTSTAKNNPEGYSLLRRAYRPWFMTKRLEEYEAVGVERDLTGLPVGKVPAEYLNAKQGTDQWKMVEAFRKMVTAVRRNEQEGLVLPTAYDQDTKQPLFDFALLTSGGSRQFNTDGIIQRYETRILMTILADFIMTGHENNGSSYALHTDKSGLFRTAINSIAQAIADVFNRHAIPRLFAVNGLKPAELPKIVPNDVDPPDLGQLAQFMTAMTQAGVQWFPDPELEKFLRDAARLPDLDKNVEQVREAQQRQAAVMALAQQQLEAIQLRAQAEQGQAEIAQAKITQADPTGVQQAAAQQQATGGDPNAQDPRKAIEARHADAQGAVATDRAKVGLKTDKVKMDQEKLKLANLKKPPPAPAGGRPPAKKTAKKSPVKKSLSAFGVDHEYVGGRR